MTAAYRVSVGKGTRRSVYFGSAIVAVLAGISAIMGALIGSPILFTLASGLLVLIFAAAAAVGYRRLISTTRQTHRAAQRTLTEAVHARVLSEKAAEYADRSYSAEIGALEYWSNSAGLSSAKLVHQLTVMRSVAGRDLLAKMATNGQWTWSDVRRALEAYRMGGTPKRNVLKVFRGSSSMRLLQLGDLCFRQNCLPQDLEDVATLYWLVYQFDGPRQFQSRQRSEFFLDALSRTGQSARARDLLHLLDGEGVSGSDRMLYMANVEHPGRESGELERDWIAAINRVYDSAGLTQIQLAPGSQSAFLRLEAGDVKPITEGPLVSVVMPVFRPDAATHLAIRSALDQSYRNLEIIVVDDGSGGEYSDALDQWAVLDSRVTIVKNETNSGAYTSRNIGYERATGKYLTVFDGDDWQHPQKIQLLVEKAEMNSDTRLVSARWARVDEALFFQYRGWKGAYITPAHVSALFPIQLVREKLGYWDTVRKAADTEFILRYQQLINGAEPIEVSEAPLTISLVGTANLSVDDFRLGFRAPDRISYRSAYEHWHRKVRDGHESGYLPFPLDRRPFPAPVRFLPNQPKHPHLDVLFVADFAESAEDAQELMECLEVLLEAGHEVGLMDHPSIATGRSSATRVNDRLQELFSSGRLTRVQQTDEAEVRTIIVKDPSAFQFELFASGAVVPRSVYVTTETPPYDSLKKRHTFEVSTVSQNLFREFGVRPVWVPTSSSANKILSRLVADSDIIPLPEGRVLDSETAAEAGAPEEGPSEPLMSHVFRILEHNRGHFVNVGS
ncbi:glycosyltransferase family A protein [Arthrobacter flavus]|uniref:Glycosyltransferase family A protein n=1 Tax=Arthrobacter flavus TaxID=95172 RepID=A0ABW4QAW5_9MICC